MRTSVHARVDRRRHGTRVVVCDRVFTALCWALCCFLVGVGVGVVVGVGFGVVVRVVVGPSLMSLSVALYSCMVGETGRHISWAMPRPGCSTDPGSNPHRHLITSLHCVLRYCVLMLRPLFCMDRGTDCVHGLRRGTCHCHRPQWKRSFALRFLFSVSFRQMRPLLPFCFALVLTITLAQVYAWGLGKVYSETDEFRKKPRVIIPAAGGSPLFSGGASAVVAVSCGVSHSLALDRDGLLYSWCDTHPLTLINPLRPSWGVSVFCSQYAVWGD